MHGDASLTPRSPGPCCLGSRALRTRLRAALARWVRRTADRGTLSPRGGRQHVALRLPPSTPKHRRRPICTTRARCCVTCGDSNPTCLRGPFEPISFGWPRRHAFARRQGITPLSLAAGFCPARIWLLRRDIALEKPDSVTGAVFQFRRPLSCPTTKGNIRRRREKQKENRITRSQLSTAARKHLNTRDLVGA